MADKPPTMKLGVLEGGRLKGRAGKRRSLTEDEQVTCTACLNDTGVETSTVIKATLAPRRSPAGKKVGGTDSWICPFCLTRGKITELIRG